MKFFIDELEILFPYEYIYPEQYAYMVELKKGLDAKGHCLLEMPSGTGKTITILSLIVAYMLRYPAKIAKLLYSTRTLSEIEKAAEELRVLCDYYKTNKLDTNVLGVILSARKNLCIHPSVADEPNGRVVDARCHALTAPFVRARHAEGEDVNVCSFYEKLDSLGRDTILPPNIYNLEDLKDLGTKQGICPYFLARQTLIHANVVIYSYHYLLDPKIAGIVSKDFNKNTVVVFDEAHNIDNVCIDSLSSHITSKNLDKAIEGINKLDAEITAMKERDSQRLKEEYKKMVDGLREIYRNREANAALANPIVPDQVLKITELPGSIRSAEHFIGFMKRFIMYLKLRMNSTTVVQETPIMFIKDVYQRVCINRKPLRFCTERLSSLLKTLEISEIIDFSSLVTVAQFATLVSTYVKGFMIIIEPFDEKSSTDSCVMHFSCLDASIAIKPILDYFNTVVITSGTLSPLDMYPKILNINPVIMTSLTMTLSRQCFLPMVVGRGNDQVALTSKWESREDSSVARNYGHLLLEMVKVVPDGVVCFFPSYLYMKSVVAAWYDQGIIEKILDYKLIFIETQNIVVTNHAIKCYAEAVERGKGALLLSVARGLLYLLFLSSFKFI